MPDHDDLRDGGPTRPDGFADDVMRAIGRVALPSPTRTFLRAIRVHSLGTAVSALVVAWHLGTHRRWPIAPRVRARSLALVMGVTVVLSTGTLAAAATLTVVAPVRLDGPRLLDRAVTGPTVAPPRSETQPGPSPSHDASPIPAAVHPTDQARGGSVDITTPRPEVGAREPGDRDDGAPDEQDGDRLDDADDNGSDGDEPDESVDEGGHGSDDEPITETPEPDDQDTSAGGADGGSEEEDQPNPEEGSGG